MGPGRTQDQVAPHRGRDGAGAPRVVGERRRHELGRDHGRPRPRPHLCPRAHPPPPPSPTHPARTHARGMTEYAARQVVVVRAGRPGGGRRWPLLVGKRARGWSEERRGARRRARVRGGRAAGGGCRSLGKLVAWRQMGSLNADPARADATLTRTRHAWVVCQHGGGLTGPAAGSISPSSRTRARCRRWHGGLDGRDASCRLGRSFLSPWTGRIPSLVANGGR